MKKYILKIVAVLFVALSVSCDKDSERIVFDGNNGQTLVAFSSSSASLPVSEKGPTTIMIPIDITTISSTERTFPVSVESTELDPGAYTFGSIVIPANSYNGVLEVTGNDVDVEPIPTNLILQIDEGNDYVTTSKSTITISVFEDNPFTGEYLIEQITPYIAGATLSDGAIVNILASGDNVEFRSFDTENYPNYCSGTFISFTFELKSDNTISIPLQDTSCGCGGSANYFDFFGSAITPSTYDLENDDVFEVSFTEDTRSTCGSPAQTTYRFTKQ